MNNKLTLSADGLIAAGKTMDVTFSSISPFLHDTNEKPPASVMAGGKIRSEYKTIFETLAQASRMGACMYLNTDGLLDTSVYYPPSGAPAVSVSMVDDGVKVESGADIFGMLDWLAENFGTSMVQSCEFEAKLPLEEAYVLFALLDSARQSTMAALSGNDSDTPAITMQALQSVSEENKNENEEAEDGLQWLAPHFASIYQMPALDSAAIEKNVQKLAQKGYVVLKQDAVELSNTVENLASNFLLVEGHLWLRSAEVDTAGKTNLTEVRGVRGRGNAVLLWSDDNNTVSLMGVSPAQVIAIAQDMLGTEEVPVFVDESLRVNEAPAEMSRKAARKAAKQAKRNGRTKKRKWWLISLIIIVVVLLFFLLVWSLV